jgi:hypothetical protein
MRKARVFLLASIAIAGSALLASQQVPPPQSRILRVSTVGPTPSVRVKGTLIYADGVGNAPGQIRHLEAKTPFEMQVGPDFTLGIIESTVEFGELDVSLGPVSGTEPIVRGTGSRVIIGNNLRPTPGALFVRTF